MKPKIIDVQARKGRARGDHLIIRWLVSAFLVLAKHISLTFGLAGIMLLSFTPASAETVPDSAAEKPAPPQPSLLLELPVLDSPFNTAHGFSFPSMNQSFAITGGVTQGIHRTLAVLWKPRVSDRSIEGLFSNRRLGGLCSSILLFDALSPFPGWTHEEGHRAVLSRRGISSRDDIYRNPFAKMVSVSHVRDEDLAWLKDRYPADMVRLAEAGGEAQVESVLRMRKDNFFGGRSSHCDLLDWWINLGTLGYYVWLCGDDEVNRITEEETRKEDADIAKRDIVGGDYLSWVYDLHRPDEPYLSGLRGRPHPSGVGVDRYIQPSELTSEERRYLKLQGRLFFLNLLSPQMFGFDGFHGTDPITRHPCRWNVAVTHHLTSFGTATGIHLFYKQGKTNLGFTYNSYLARYKYWPGLSVELVRYAIGVGGKTLAVSGSASAWLQPAEQRFASTKAQAGYGLALGAAYPLTRQLAWSLEGEAKSKGWVAGNVYLEPAVQARTGIDFSIK